MFVVAAPPLLRDMEAQTPLRADTAPMFAFAIDLAAIAAGLRPLRATRKTSTCRHVGLPRPRVSPGANDTGGVPGVAERGLAALAQVTTETVSCYSFLSATIGSTLAARFAGTQLATTAARPSAMAAPPNATTSVGGTP